MASEGSSTTVAFFTISLNTFSRSFSAMLSVWRLDTENLRVGERKGLAGRTLWSLQGGDLGQISTEKQSRKYRKEMPFSLKANVLLGHRCCLRSCDRVQIIWPKLKLTFSS